MAGLLMKTPTAAAPLPPRLLWIIARITDSFEVSDAEARFLLDSDSGVKRRLGGDSPPARSPGASPSPTRPDDSDDKPEEPPSIRGLLNGTGRRSLFVFHQPRVPSSAEVGRTGQRASPLPFVNSVFVHDMARVGSPSRWSPPPLPCRHSIPLPTVLRFCAGF